MKNITLRTIAGVLILGMAVTAASCANKADDIAAPAQPDVTTVAATETEKPYLDNLPDDLDFEGRTLRFTTNDEDSFETVEDAADVVDTAVYLRNRKIEERLNVNFEMTINVDWEGIKSPFVNSVKAGSDDYDIYGGYGYWSINLATSGYMLNLANAEYIDLTQSYWGDKFIDAMSYKDYIYWLTGDITLTYTNGIYSTYVNMAKWNDSFAGEDLYGLVRDGKWTLDNLITHSASAYSDLNGDGTVNDGDFLGFMYTTEDPIDGMSMAAGVTFTEFDSDGVPYITLVGSERAVTFNEKLTNLCTGVGTLKMTSDDCKSTFTAFGNCSGMFTIGRIRHAVTYLRDMQDDFAIIPAPKLDEEQENYLTTLHDGTTIIGLPKTISDESREAACATLEALAAESAKSLTPTYLDVALKNKYTRDAESAEMIDLIRENIVSDFGFMYTDTGFNNFFRNQTTKGAEIASTIAKTEKSWNTKLEKILTSLEENA